MADTPKYTSNDALITTTGFGSGLLMPRRPSGREIYSGPNNNNMEGNKKGINSSMEKKQEVGHKDYKKLMENDVTSSEEEVSFFHDFVAGGVAGSASVIVGHPFDTIKVCHSICFDVRKTKTLAGLYSHIKFLLFLSCCNFRFDCRHRHHHNR